METIIVIKELGELKVGDTFKKQWYTNQGDFYVGTSVTFPEWFYQIHVSHFKVIKVCETCGQEKK